MSDSLYVSYLDKWIGKLLTADRNKCIFCGKAILWAFCQRCSWWINRWCIPILVQNCLFFSFLACSNLICGTPGLVQEFADRGHPPCPLYAKEWKKRNYQYSPDSILHYLVWFYYGSIMVLLWFYYGSKFLHMDICT